MAVLTMDHEFKHFGEWLLFWRDEFDMTQTEVGKAVGVSKQHVSNLERRQQHAASGAESSPSIELVDKLALLFKRPIEEARNLAFGPKKSATQSESDYQRFRDLADVARRVDQSGKTIDQLLDISFSLLHLPRQTRNDIQIMADALFKKYAAREIDDAVKKEQTIKPAAKITRSAPRKRDKIDEAIDNALTKGGKPVSEENREIIRDALEKLTQERSQTDE